VNPRYRCFTCTHDIKPDVKFYSAEARNFAMLHVLRDADAQLGSRIVGCALYTVLQIPELVQHYSICWRSGLLLE